MDMLAGTRNTRKRQHEPEAEQSVPPPGGTTQQQPKERPKRPRQPRQPKKAKLGPSTELEGQAGPSTTQPTSPSSVSVSVSRPQKTPTQRRQRQGQGQGSSAAMFKGESQRQRHYRPVPDLLSATTIPTIMSAMTDMQIADARRRSANEVFATVLARDISGLSTQKTYKKYLRQWKARNCAAVHALLCLPCSHVVVEVPWLHMNNKSKKSISMFLHFYTIYSLSPSLSLSLPLSPSLLSTCSCQLQFAVYIHCDGMCMKPDGAVDESIVDYTVNAALILDYFESVVFHNRVQRRVNPNAGYIGQVGLVSDKQKGGKVDEEEVEDE